MTTEELTILLWCVSGIGFALGSGVTVGSYLVREWAERAEDARLRRRLRQIEGSHRREIEAASRSPRWNGRAGYRDDAREGE